MPGRIVDMDQLGAVGALDLKKDRSNAQIVRSAPAVQSQAEQQANGVAHADEQYGVRLNGDAGLDVVVPTTNGEANSAATIMEASPDAPPLDQSWRDGVTNKSFGKLLTRVSHQCFVDLQETLTSMSAMQDQTQRPQINGTSAATLDTSETSLKKKRMLMDFASTQRDRFIKTLVLTDASRNEEDHARLITVRQWQEKQRIAYRYAMDAIGLTKVNTINFKQANPNIEGAMGVLTSGKSSRMPHLGYIPPEKASAKELLKTLRDMNVMIATRLSLSDELSPHMEEYTIANGRVTFRVPGEFEVDLSAAEDDPESQFFFLDLRLTFKPSTGAISDTLRSHLEARVNNAIMKKGLPGCYDFLHNFVLTYKINVLRSQVNDLTQGRWFECIRAENLRRSLTVQYWTGKPGPKSWLEFGIGSGKGEGARSRKAPTSCLSVRWFRQGVEVKDEPLTFYWAELNLERCLSAVIKSHTSWILDDLLSRITSLTTADSAIEVKCIEDDIAQSALALSFPSLATSLRVTIDTVTGLYSLSPPSAPTARAERHLNNDSTADPAQWLANAICAAAQDKVHRIAEFLHWAPVSRIMRQDDLQKLFGAGVRCHSTFVPHQTWGEQWALAVTFCLSGEVWWAVSLTEKRDEQGSVVGRIISSAQGLRHVSSSALAGEASRAKLLHIERCAVAEVAFGALSAQLKEMQVSHHFDHAAQLHHNDAVAPLDAPKSSTILYFLPSTLLRHNRKKPNLTWTTDLARLTHHGMVEGGFDGTGVRHDLRLALESGKLKRLQKHLTHFRDRNLILGEDGAVALRILAPFGKPFAEQLRSRLQSIEHLDRYLGAMQKYGLKCTPVSLSKLSFRYQESPELSATLIFPTEEGSPASLKLQPSDINPHSRIRILLEAGLNATDDKGVDAVGFILVLTLPLLQAFERIETSHKFKQAVLVLPRSSTKYLLRYKAPLLNCTFEIRSKMREEGKEVVAYWYVQLRRDGAALPEAFTQALSQELWQAKGQYWRGVGNGVTATAMGIGEAIDKLDAIVQRFEGIVAEDSKSAIAAGLAPSSKNASKPQASNSQQQQNASASQNASIKKEQTDVIQID